jgi:eukaryotic-like serine/threonine-protein kinase
LAATKGRETPKHRIPGFRLVEKLGQGSMGTVYKGVQKSLERTVAIKVMPPELGRNANFVKRFLREARSVAKLNHPNIVSGIDVGEVEGWRYFVMEFIDGVTVGDILRRGGAMDERRSIRIIRQVAQALEHAHKHLLVHRDIKPDNIMIARDGVAKLCDLGLAKEPKEGGSTTEEGLAMGTPNYISPEQAQGKKKIDIRSDLYSLGATFYHMVTGVLPYDGPNPAVIMTRHLLDPLPPPRTRNSALMRGTCQIIEKMMMKTCEDRYQAPEDLIAHLTILEEGGTTIAPIVVRRRRSHIRRRRRR